MYNPSAHKHKDKQNVVYSYNGISFSYKKEYNLIHATTYMNLESITLSEINQTKKKKKGQISRFHLFEDLEQANSER